MLFGLISIDSADLFEVRQTTVTRGHPYKLSKPQCTILRPSLHNVLSVYGMIYLLILQIFLR